MTTQKTISVGELKLCNKEPFVLVGGINVIESESMALKVAETFVSITEELGIPYIFKASFDINTNIVMSNVDRQNIRASQSTHLHIHNVCI